MYQKLLLPASAHAAHQPNCIIMPVLLVHTTLNFKHTLCRFITTRSGKKATTERTTSNSFMLKNISPCYHRQGGKKVCDERQKVPTDSALREITGEE
jgi:hypothetical protein